MPRAAKAARVCGRTPASAKDCNASPDPLQGRRWRDDQDTVTVDGREDPSERADDVGRGSPVYAIGSRAIGRGPVHDFRMTIPQGGIFALGTASHAYLELDALTREAGPDLVRSVASLREPRTTMGG